MSRIVLGKSSGKNIELDLDMLLRGRMLIQANSGKGKSWLLRRLAEQLFGKIQVVIIDPEGEFATLREKFGYVLVGKGGETPADPRSAALVAHKLLELRASAVCDLYEMKPSARHEWVRRFCEALVDAPKNLWHPCVIALDEAHTFCPEKGSGESEASEAVIGLGTRGRKRGFCIVPATQRLGKLRKDLAAELLNVMIGGTFIDIDRKRAADALGIYGADQHRFFDEIKVLPRGQFFCLGPAISNERVLIEVGPVETTHPEAGSAKHAAEPPPAPEKIQALLPKLADLPKAAEEQAKTVAELRAEIRSLKAQLRAQPTKTKTIQVADPRAIERAVKQVETQFHKELAARDAVIKRLVGGLGTLAKTAADLAGVKLPPIKALEIPKPVSSVGIVAHPVPPVREALPSQRHRSTPEISADGITPAQQRILRALSEFEAIGRTEVSRTWIAARAGASHRSSAYTNNLGALRSRGLIDYGTNSSVRLTGEGRQQAPVVEAPLTSEQMFESCLRLLGPAQQRILRALRHEHPASLAREELAVRAEASATSSAFTNNLGALRSAGMIEYGPNSTVKCSDWLFID